MSRTKEYLQDLEDERMQEWISERISDDTVDEFSDEWQALAASYADYQAHLSEMEERAFELEWLKENNQTLIYAIFLNEMNTIKFMAINSLSNTSFKAHEGTFIKMSYAHAVTLLESFLGDTLKSLILEKPEFLTNAMKLVKEVAEPKYSIFELSKTDLNLSSLTIKHISEILFHNIPKVMNVYGLVLGKKLNIDYSIVSKITKIRHDIVHRNGRKPDGTENAISAEDLHQAINDITIFADNLQQEIYPTQINGSRPL